MTRDDDESQGESETDRAWHEIVAHYGERPTVEPDVRPPVEAAPAAVPPEPRADDASPWASVDEEAGFRPPPAPPFPRPRTWQRGVAWTGVFLGPALAFVLTLLDVHLPAAIGWAVFGWTIGGFVYLAVIAPRLPRDPWDDGSRV